eukprot:Phypoly_transcript_09086.p1 GENE.Phypoly_transcript_09086~~Phypoly_transcript_09086.p1  ORF type:complete len:350 (+),score=54.13 Phypoly_transcript_09086:349-1398(+)
MKRRIKSSHVFLAPACKLFALSSSQPSSTYSYPPYTTSSLTINENIDTHHPCNPSSAPNNTNATSFNTSSPRVVPQQKMAMVESRRKSRRRPISLINTLFCHELFANVFVMLDYVDLVRASQVCGLWRNHMKEMQGTLFRHFYIHLGGDPANRREQVDWKLEVKAIVQCETDLTVYNYACLTGDEALKESIINDGGLCMDLCNHIVQKGGSIPASALLVDFKKRLATQVAKCEFYDMVNALCVLLQSEEGMEPCFCLRACVDNGNLIKKIRKLFLESNQQVDSLRITLFTTDFLLARKLPVDNQTKLEVFNIVKILGVLQDQEMWTLKKVESTKRLGGGKVKNLIFEVS